MDATVIEAEKEEALWTYRKEKGYQPLMGFLFELGLILDDDFREGMWAPRGQQPRVPSASTREKAAFFGALDLKTGCLLTQQASTFNGETFGNFLRFILQSTQGKLHLILDNAKYHRARILKEFFVQNKERLELIFLPSYSPELNPVERVWRITRRQVTHNRYFQSVQELKTAQISHFVKWQLPNSALRALCANI